MATNNLAIPISPIPTPMRVWVGGGLFNFDGRSFELEGDVNWMDHLDLYRVGGYMDAHARSLFTAHVLVYDY